MRLPTGATVLIPQLLKKKKKERTSRQASCNLKMIGSSRGTNYMHPALCKEMHCVDIFKFMHGRLPKETITNRRVIMNTQLLNNDLSCTEHPSNCILRAHFHGILQLIILMSLELLLSFHLLHRQKRGNEGKLKACTFQRH